MSMYLSDIPPREHWLTAPLPVSVRRAGDTVLEQHHDHRGKPDENKNARKAG